MSTVNGSHSAATEQQIDPWDVQAGRDEQGNALAFDYVAISQYAAIVIVLLNAEFEQEMGY